MQHKIFAYTILNVKSLLKDKIPFLWSIILPFIMLSINIKDIQHEKDIVSWWVYIVLCSYIYGVGVYALELKEEGCLRTIFSIHNSSMVFFLGNVLTQIIFSFISISLFNLAAVILKGFSFIRLTLYSLECILLCIPIAFLGYGLTLFKKVHVNTIKTIFTILNFGMFMLTSTTSVLNSFNPIYNISNFMLMCNVVNIIYYIIFVIMSVIIGSVGIVFFNPNSNERR